MIDRAARERLTSVLRSYMNEEISAFEVDKLLGDLRRSSPDKTVKSTARDLWGCYDDLKDHNVVASKQEWDYFNRVLLLLSPEAELENVRRVRWHVSQIFAGAGFLLAVFLCSRIGWNGNLLKVTCSFALASMAIRGFNQQRRKKSSELPLYPFSSFHTLSMVRRKAVGFSKNAYPKALAYRRIRDPIAEWILLVPSVVLWLIFSPIVLFIQTLPEPAWETRIVTAPPTLLESGT